MIKLFFTSKILIKLARKKNENPLPASHNLSFFILHHNCLYAGLLLSLEDLKFKKHLRLDST